MKATLSRWILRLAGLFIVLAIGAALLVPPLMEKRTERRVRTLLLAVQEGLQRYHVEEEMYPKRMMTGRELIQLLADGGHLESPPANPWSGRPYADAAEDDWLRYRTDSLAETYELTVLFPGTEAVEFRLDSTKNQSLE